MKRKLCFLFVLPLLLAACEGVEDPNPELDGEVPPPPGRLNVISTDVAMSVDELSMQYAYITEDDLFYSGEPGDRGVFNGAIFIDEGSGVEAGKSGGLDLTPYDWITQLSRTRENLTLLFQMPIRKDYHSSILFTEWWHSALAEEMGLPIVRDTNELVNEVICYEEQNKQNYLLSCRFCYAGVKNITISADKVLFGCDAGADIAHKFRMVSAPTLLLAIFPTFAVTCRIEDEKPTNLVAFNNSLLSAGGYAVKFAEQPTEKYDEVTFTVAMDILLPDGGERTLTGSVKVVFE